MYFPRELLPLSMTAANLVNMLIAYAIFLPYAIWVRGFSTRRRSLLLIPITVAFFVFTAALAMLLSGAMVYFRDVEFLHRHRADRLVLPRRRSSTASTTSRNATLRSWMERNPVVPFINAYRKAVFYKSSRCR